MGTLPGSQEGNRSCQRLQALPGRKALTASPALRAQTFPSLGSCSPWLGCKLDSSSGLFPPPPFSLFFFMHLPSSAVMGMAGARPCTPRSTSTLALPPQLHQRCRGWLAGGHGHLPSPGPALPLRCPVHPHWPPAAAKGCCQLRPHAYPSLPSPLCRGSVLTSLSPHRGGQHGPWGGSPGMGAALCSLWCSVSGLALLQQTQWR